MQVDAVIKIQSIMRGFRVRWQKHTFIFNAGGPGLHHVRWPQCAGAPPAWWAPFSLVSPEAARKAHDGLLKMGLIDKWGRRRGGYGNADNGAVDNP